MSSVEPLKARRLYLLLRDRILSGEASPESRLPSEPALASTYGVSRVTVRRALDELPARALSSAGPAPAPSSAAMPLPRPWWRTSPTCSRISWRWAGAPA